MAGETDQKCAGGHVELRIHTGNCWVIYVANSDIMWFKTPWRPNVCVCDCDEANIINDMKLMRFYFDCVKHSRMNTKALCGCRDRLK